MPTLKYKRVLLKLSGEALAGENKTGIDPATVATICRGVTYRHPARGIIAIHEAAKMRVVSVGLPEIVG